MIHGDICNQEVRAATVNLHAKVKEFAERLAKNSGIYESPEKLKADITGK